MSDPYERREALQAENGMLRAEITRISQTVHEIEKALGQIYQGLQQLGQIEAASVPLTQLINEPTLENMVQGFAESLPEIVEATSAIGRERIVDLRAEQRKYMDKIYDNNKEIEDVGKDITFIGLVDRGIPVIARYLPKDAPNPIERHDAVGKPESSDSGAEPGSKSPDTGADKSNGGDQPPSSPPGTDDSGPPADGPGDTGSNGSDS
jgi:hypothetical protein